MPRGSRQGQAGCQGSRQHLVAQHEDARREPGLQLKLPRLPASLQASTSPNSSLWYMLLGRLQLLVRLLRHSRHLAPVCR